jgi:hypothetical protein
LTQAAIAKRSLDEAEENPDAHVRRMPGEQA